MGLVDFFSRKPSPPKPVETCACPICSRDDGFAMPSAVLEAVANRNLVIVAGPEVGVERERVQRESLYELLAYDMHFDKNSKLPFPELMSLYCQREGGRQRLLTHLLHRLSFIKGFRDLWEEATQFYRDFARIPHLETVVTTNWDDLFEEQCNAVPLNSLEDLEYWDVLHRKVVKLHGSMKSPGSVIVTREDQTARYKQLSAGVGGTNLKGILDGKTLLYIGYRSIDPDFDALHKLLTLGGNEKSPLSYLVTTNSEHAGELFRKNVATIVTSCRNFLPSLREHLIADGTLLPTDVIWEVADLLDEVDEAHLELMEKIDYSTQPTAILTGYYQDGLSHALQNIRTYGYFGLYSAVADVKGRIESYKTEFRPRSLEHKNYADVAYIDGYLAGFALLLTDDEGRASPPIYYVCGADVQPRDQEECLAMLKKAHYISPEIYEYCVKSVEHFDLIETGLTLQHSTYL